ncbi:MAG TPA: hypothetical protein VGD94_15975 [Vicinamibacterales bacterium]
MSTLSPDDQRVLDLLRKAVEEALERKHRLGQYAVIWQDDKVVRVEPEDIPALLKAGRCERRA